MQHIVTISLRNLLRQQRRNILLGIAIAFGAMVLIMANSFSHGISKVLFERVVRYTNGHVSVSYMRNGNMMNQVFYDDVRLMAAVKKAAPDALRSEEAIGIFGRAIGNGVADNVILVGVDLSGKYTEKDRKETESNFKMIEGNFFDLKDKSNGIPVLVSEQKAKYLKVKKGDILRVRFTGVTNQATSAQLYVVGIFKPANIFMSSPIFLEIHDVKALSGYGHHDLAGIHVMVNNPQKTAKLIANRLHDELIPGLAMIDGNVQFKNKAIQAAVLGFRTDSASLRYITPHVKLLSGDSAKTFGYAGVILSTKLAQQLGAKPFDTLRTIWKGKYDSLGANGGTMKIIVTGIADSAAPIPVVSLLINEKDFYKGYYMPLPAIPGKEMFATMPDSTNPLWKGLAPEFVLMKRCATTQEVTKLTREMSRAKYKGMMVNVQSMYETASAILNVEFALNLITVAAGMILFFIILIGVINTLRMTIKERTREIGTVRAIGMQKSDVRSMFLLETAFLAVIASTIGACVGFATMFGLSQLTINAGDNPMGMLLVDGHLFFAPTVIATLAYIGFIVILAVFTAYFPAKRAANMQASDALRHYE